MSPALEGRRIGLLTASSSRLGGGVFEAVVAQANVITALGARPFVFSLADAFTQTDRDRFGTIPVTACPVSGPAQIGYAPRLGQALRAADLDLLHLHGIWMYPSRAGATWARQTGRPYLISPHGMLDRWITGRGRWKKAIARVGYERQSWRRAFALHALTAKEAADIERESGRTDSIVIPNAGPAATAPGAPRGPMVLYIGRIHGKKNLLALVAGWRLAGLAQGARLILAGWGDKGDIAALQGAIGDGAGGIEFIGPVYGARKAALLREARFVVLPSLSEGLPMAILEAWANGAPTIMTRECNLDEGFAAGAAIDCGFAPQAIAQALAQALALDDRSWQAMATSALGLASGRFSAVNVTEQWGRTYAAALGLGNAA